MFEDRFDAGLSLSGKLLSLKGRKGFLVLAIPRGGVVVGKVIADKLKIPSDVIIVRKIGAPNQSELAIGAVGPGGIIVRDEGLISKLGVKEEYLEKAIGEKRKEITDRLKKYRQGKSPLNLEDKTVILVDDGIATGATIEAAILYLRKKRTKKIILAVPVAPKDTAEKFKRLVDKLIILETPIYFGAVGEFYRNFPQVTDGEVIELLKPS